MDFLSGRNRNPEIRCPGLEYARLGQAPPWSGQVVISPLLETAAECTHFTYKHPLEVLVVIELS